MSCPGQFCPWCPIFLPAEALLTWRVVVADLQKRKLLCAPIMGAVNAYCMASYQAEKCTAAIAKDGAFLPNGKAHAAMGCLNKALGNVARLANELGLTPAARARKGASPEFGNGHGEGETNGAPTGLAV